MKLLFTICIIVFSTLSNSEELKCTCKQSSINPDTFDVNYEWKGFKKAVGGWVGIYSVSTPESSTDGCNFQQGKDCKDISNCYYSFNYMTPITPSGSDKIMGVGLKEGHIYTCIAWNSLFSCSGRIASSTFTCDNEIIDISFPKPVKTVPVTIYIATAVGGFIILISIIIGIVIWYRRRSQSTSDEYSTVPMTDVTETSNTEVYPDTPSSLSPVYVATNVPY